MATTDRTTGKRPTKKAAPKAEPAPTPSERLEAEATYEPPEGYPEGTMLGHLTTDGQVVEFHVTPIDTWRGSAIRGLHNGDYDTWAEGALSPAEYRVWSAIDPTLGQAKTFYVNLIRLTGVDLGE